MKKLVMGLGMLMLVVGMIGCGGNNESDESNENNENNANGVLTMGTSADYYPFQFIEVIDGEEVIAGFDVDIAHHIAKALEMELEIVDMEFNTLITALRSERVDMVLSSMSPTEDRAEVIDFSNVYYQSNEGLILASSPISELADLNGLTIGVQTGSVQEEIGNNLVEEGIDIDLLLMDSIPNLVQQLSAGRVDAIIVNQLTAKAYSNADEALYVADIIPTVELGTAVAFPQGSDLTEQVNAILAEMEADGTMEALFEQWLEGDDLN